MPLYLGKDGVNREQKEIYLGLGGVNKKQNELYQGVGGVNKQIYKQSNNSIYLPNPDQTGTIVDGVNVLNTRSISFYPMCSASKNNSSSTSLYLYLHPTRRDVSYFVLGRAVWRDSDSISVSSISEFYDINGAKASMNYSLVNPNYNTQNILIDATHIQNISDGIGQMLNPLSLFGISKVDIYAYKILNLISVSASTTELKISI